MLSSQNPSTTAARDKYRFKSDTSEFETDSDDNTSDDDEPMTTSAPATAQSPVVVPKPALTLSKPLKSPSLKPAVTPAVTPPVAQESRARSPEPGETRVDS